MLSLRGASIAVAASAVLAIGVAEVALVPAAQTVAASPASFVTALNNGSAAVLRTAATNPGLIGAAALPAQVNTVELNTAAGLSRAQLAGQRVIYGYPGLTPPARLLQLIRHGEVGGVIFFSGNYANRSQFRKAVRRLEAANASATNPARAYPLLLMTDQEGGEVRRLPGAPVQSEKQIGAIRPLSAAETAAGKAGSGAAANLRSYGLNVDLAPVLDVYRRAGDFDDQYQRSYSTRASVVSALGAKFVAAMQKGNVAATVKHFPGLGAATKNQDTDVAPVTINVSAATLKSRDEYPYKAAIAAGVKLVMVSWAVYPHLGSKRPAGLSSVIVQGQLRKRLGYQGVTITDAIGAGALRAYGSTANRTRLAAAAGMDLILASDSVAQGVQSLDGLDNAYKTGALNRAAFRAVVAQILALRQGLPA
ncbi:MAG TPA: glycoside hydrolase family 3 N-terminal domain-containing protein [Streptosporangiaceae bacterium]|nr:glycoside hydrolase family 3 N-terminal domain-containing protein [Streptosporangiaceae bacterium]